jgi:hypothetical protein
MVSDGVSRGPPEIAGPMHDCMFEPLCMRAAPDDSE